MYSVFLCVYVYDIRHGYCECKSLLVINQTCIKIEYVQSCQQNTEAGDANVVVKDIMSRCLGVELILLPIIHPCKAKCTLRVFEGRLGSVCCAVGPSSQNMSTGQYHRRPSSLLASSQLHH